MIKLIIAAMVAALLLTGTTMAVPNLEGRMSGCPNYGKRRRY